MNYPERVVIKYDCELESFRAASGVTNWLLLLLQSREKYTWRLCTGLDPVRFGGTSERFPR